jgi:hypothetical protein
MEYGPWLSARRKTITRSPRRTDKAIVARTLKGKVCSGLVDVRRCLDRRSQPGSCLAGPLGHRRQLQRIRYHIICPHMTNVTSRLCSQALAPTTRRCTRAARTRDRSPRSPRTPVRCRHLDEHLAETDCPSHSRCTGAGRGGPRDYWVACLPESPGTGATRPCRRVGRCCGSRARLPRWRQEGHPCRRHGHRLGRSDVHVPRPLEEDVAVPVAVVRLRTICGACPSVCGRRSLWSCDGCVRLRFTAGSARTTPLIPRSSLCEEVEWRPSWRPVSSPPWFPL